MPLAVNALAKPADLGDSRERAYGTGWRATIPVGPGRGRGRLDRVVLGVAANERREGLMVSDLTHMATVLSRARPTAGKKVPEAAVARACAIVSAHFFEAEIGATRAEDIAALTPGVRYSQSLPLRAWCARWERPAARSCSATKRPPPADADASRLAGRSPRSWCWATARSCAGSARGRGSDLGTR